MKVFLNFMPQGFRGLSVEVQKEIFFPTQCISGLFPYPSSEASKRASAGDGTLKRIDWNSEVVRRILSLRCLAGGSFLRAQSAQTCTDHHFGGQGGTLPQIRLAGTWRGFSLSLYHGALVAC